MRKGLRLFATKGDASKLPKDQTNQITRVLRALDAASCIDDLDLPGFRLHALKGNLEEYHSITIKNNWRIIFKFIKGDVYLVDYLDYH